MRMNPACAQDHLNKLSFSRSKESPLRNFSIIGPVVSEEMLENVDERRDAGVTGILLAHS